MYRLAVTNRKLCPGDFLERVQQLAEGTQYQAILLREKDLNEIQYEALAEKVLEITRRNKKKCILHSFDRVAERLGHPFLHLPLSVWDQLSADRKRELRSRFQELGTSVHSTEQLQRAVSLRADYVIAGHIYETACKKGMEARGLDFLHEICVNSPIPVYAIGGITGEREESVIRQGAAGVCIMSGCMRQVVV